jgi:hypothetical protein
MSVTALLVVRVRKRVAPRVHYIGGRAYRKDKFRGAAKEELRNPVSMLYLTLRGPIQDKGRTGWK